MPADRRTGLKSAEVYARLRSAGYRLTGPRRALVDTLLAAEGPLCADQVHARVGTHGLNLSTVYRNLSRFVAMGWLEAMPGLNGERRYSVGSAADGAVTVLCLDCGEVRSLSAEARGLCAAVADLGFRPDSIRVTLSAHCDHRCAAAALNCPASVA